MFNIWEKCHLKFLLWSCSPSFIKIGRNLWLLESRKDRHTDTHSRTDRARSGLRYSVIMKWLNIKTHRQAKNIQKKKEKVEARPKVKCLPTYHILTMSFKYWSFFLLIRVKSKCIHRCHRIIYVIRKRIHVSKGLTRAEF